MPISFRSGHAILILTRGKELVKKSKILERKFTLGLKIRKKTSPFWQVHKSHYIDRHFDLVKSHSSEIESAKLLENNIPSKKR